jgi:hypothetical protein
LTPAYLESAAHVEARVQDHRASGNLLERGYQRMKAGIGADQDVKAEIYRTLCGFYYNLARPKSAAKEFLEVRINLDRARTSAGSGGVLASRERSSDCGSRRVDAPRA